MKKIFVALIVVAMTLSVGVSSVEAKRMGGGSSFGKKSQSMNRQQATPAQNQAAAKAAPPAAAAAAGAAGAAKPSAWKGMLGGALLGLGLGALLSSMGLGGAMASMISTILMVGLLGLAGMFIYRMVRRKMDSNNGMKPSFAGSGALNNVQSGSFTPEIASRIEPAQKTSFNAATFDSASANSPVGVIASSTASNNAMEIPADFDVASFVRHSKTNFIRLQAAWDRGDTDDIRDFTTPEMFGELKMQLQERGNSINKTDVITIDAEFLGLETIGNDYMAGVKFSGMIKDDPTALAEPFNEIWNLTKPINGNGGWTLAGIEQVV